MGNNSTLFLPTFCNKISHFFPSLQEKFLEYCAQRITASSSGVRISKLTYYAYTFLQPF